MAKPFKNPDPPEVPMPLAFRGATKTLALIVLILPGAGPAFPAPRRLQTSLDRAQWRELQRDLRAPYPDKRRRTVTKVAAAGGVEALELVLEALGDQEPEVADEAQLVLASLDQSVAVRALEKALFGRRGLGSRDSMIRLRVAEALGRLQRPVDVRSVARALDHRDPDVCRALLWSLERLGARGVDGLRGDLGPCLQRVERLAEGAAPEGVRAAALQALAVLDAERFRGAVAFQRLKGRSRSGPEVRASILLGMARVGPPGEARAVLQEALGDGSQSVRAKALRVALLHGPDMGLIAADLGAIAERLELEPRPALRHLVVSCLQGLTGLRHRDHAPSWRHAVSSLPEGWRPVAPPVDPGLGADQSARPEPLSTAAAGLGQLDPGSDHLAILVDFSGSLWNERPDGTCRKDQLDPEMDRLLQRLDPLGVFLLIPFTGEPHPFTKEPVRADAKGIRRARRFFKTAHMRGQGNLFDAVQYALAKPTIDRILVLTDGAPTGGTRWNVELMGSLLEEATRFSPVIFDFVLFDAPKRLQRQWGLVARRSSGRLIIVDTQ